MSQKDSYRENYEKLQQISEKLSQSDSIDIDELVPMVDDATRAYQLCQSRIEAVEAALNKRLDQTSDTEQTEN